MKQQTFSDIEYAKRKTRSSTDGHRKNAADVSTANMV
ncbi:MAG: hypothetical protein JG770_938 [Mahella sp.]|nr:hypothetical protein [Mahella sp.]MDK2992267.1 hypothetical protein [Clostridiales bacterium]